MKTHIIYLNPNRTPESGYGVMTVLLLLLLAALFALEMSTDFLEKMGGRYMRWSNRNRPMVGTTWEYQSHSAAAMQQLSELVSDQEEIRRELQSRDDFARLPQQLAGRKILTISREKLLELYGKLPTVYARRLGTPLKLMEYTVVEDWNRTAFAGFEGRVDVYFLTGGNLVLEKITLEKSFFTELENWGRSFKGELNGHPDFEGRVFSAKDFVNALAVMGEDYGNVIRELDLLRSSSTLVKVGISRRWLGGTVEMGFQFADGMIELYPVPDDFAFQLLDYMPPVKNESDFQEDILP